MRKYIQIGNLRVSVLLCLAVILALLAALAAGVLTARQASLNRWAAETGVEALTEFAGEAAQEKMEALPKEYKKLARAKNNPGMEEALKEELDGLFARYDAGGALYDELVVALDNYGYIPWAAGYAEEIARKAEAAETSRVLYDEAVALTVEKDYAKALSILGRVTDDSPVYAAKAAEQIDAVETLVKDEALREVKAPVSRGDYAGARALADAAAGRYPENAKLDAVYSYIEGQEALMSNLVPYDGPVEHVFMRCLMAFPEITYSGNDLTAAYDIDCLTPYEFKAILRQLYDNGYMLIDINMLLAEEVGGVATLASAPLMLPAGKKPLVLSVDDVVYDARMLGRGMADKLIVDDNGKVAAFTEHADGEVAITYDNEVFPILDAFCEENPDFSFRGAKGTLALTGFQGILGYRTQRDAPEGTDYESEKAGALAVVEALKENGWTFGSHSYAHAYMGQQLNYAGVKEDTERWSAEVWPLVGDTRLFFFPYGDMIGSADPKFQILYEAGFRIFCMVGSSKPFSKMSDNGLGLFQDRRSLDGYSIRYFQDYFTGLFDASAVVDPIRR